MKTNPLSLKGKKGSRIVKYTKKDLILYALGCGENDLKYVYEKNPYFSGLPSFPTVLLWDSTTLGDVLDFSLEYNLEGDNVFGLHGEQAIEIYHPLPHSGTFQIDSEVKEVIDKKKGAYVLVEFLMKDKIKIYNKLSFGIFFVNAGGFDQNPKKSLSEDVQIPKRRCDRKVEITTTKDQALLYRLSGDYNPLHIDPETAKNVGFHTPILHGLCSYGISCRMIVKEFLNNKPDHLKFIKVRFSSPVFPGETLVFETWKCENEVIFEVFVKERNVKCLSNCSAKLQSFSKL